MSTVIISILLVLIVFLIIRKMILDKKSGKRSCGCGCSSCPMKGECSKSK